MVRALISWSLHNRFIVLLGTVGLIVLGIHSARNLNVEAYPDPTPPLVEVITQNPGASPEEMERLIGIPIETALNGMPGLKYLRSISLAGLNDIKCQFEYGTDYWTARQEVINRIGMVSNLPPGVNPGLSPWSPTGEIVRYVLEGDGLHASTSSRPCRTGCSNGSFKTVPGRDRRDGLRRDRQAIPGLARHPVDEAVRRDLADGHRRDLAVQCQRRRRRPRRWDRSRTTSGPSATWARGVDSLDPAVADHAYAIEVEKLEDIQDVVVTTYNNMPVYVKQIAKVVIGYQPRLGIVGRNGENDVVEGIVLMRKYEKSLPTSERVAREDRRAQREQAASQGDEDQDLQPADRAGPRDDAQRAAQPGRRHGAGDPDPVHLPGRRRRARASWRS